MSVETASRTFVGSEVGTLRRVLLHRPDRELKRLTPRNKDELLFDDVLWVKRARQEHDAFADALAERGVEVLYLEKLLAETLELSTARDEVLTQRWRPRRSARGSARPSVSGSPARWPRARPMADRRHGAARAPVRL